MTGRSLELVGPPEVFDQLPRRVRFACVAMIGEAATVSGGEPPGVALVQMREDLTRAAIEAAVLRLEDGDPVRAAHGSQLLTLVRPRLDLTRDEVDPQLRKHLPHRR